MAEVCDLYAPIWGMSTTLRVFRCVVCAPAGAFRRHRGGPPPRNAGMTAHPCFDAVRHGSSEGSGSGRGDFAPGVAFLIRPNIKLVAVLNYESAKGFPTTVGPIIQNGLKPVFVDAHIPSYNVDVSQLDSALFVHSVLTRLTGILGGWGVSLLLMRLKGLERQKEDFYALVTHDIKSSLTTILAYTELLLTDERHELDKEAREAISAVERSGNKIRHLVNDFLDLARLESGRITLNKGAVDVGGLLSGVYADFEQRAREKKLDLNLELPEDRVLCMLDKRYVELAVGNLVENAINYTPSGSVTLNVEPQTGSGGDFVVISVSDTGPGIPKEYVGKIFNKYFRSPRTSGVKGTGLGLALVKEVADIHGGSVEVQCTEGGGCTFRLLLPA